MEMVTTRAQRREQKSGLLLDAAAGVIAQKGYGESSMQEIAAAAGVSVGTLYLYFENKEAILLALSERLYQRLAERLDAVAAMPCADGTARLIRMTAALVELYVSESRLSLVLLTKTIGMRPAFEAQYYRCFTLLTTAFLPVLEQLSAAGQLRFPDLSVAATAHVQLMNGLTANALAREEMGDPAALAALMLRYQLRALAIPFDEAALERTCGAFLADCFSAAKATA